MPELVFSLKEQVGHVWNSNGSYRNSNFINRGSETSLAGSLRAVKMDYSDFEKTVYVRFFYQGCGSDLIMQKIKELLQKSVAFLHAGYSIEGYAQRLDMPAKLPFTGYPLYVCESEVRVEESELKKISLLYRFQEIVRDALLGKITPHLRAVKIDVDELRKIFYFWFYYDGTVSERDRLVATSITRCANGWSDLPQ